MSVPIRLWPFQHTSLRQLHIQLQILDLFSQFLQFGFDFLDRDIIDIVPVFFAQLFQPGQAGISIEVFFQHSSIGPKPQKPVFCGVS